MHETLVWSLLVSQIKQNQGAAEFLELVEEPDAGVVRLVELEHLGQGLKLPCVVCLPPVCHILGTLFVLPTGGTRTSTSTSSLQLTLEP